MFESELANVLVSGATTLIYIAGLIGFVAWLKGRDGDKREKTAATISGSQ